MYSISVKNGSSFVEIQNDKKKVKDPVLYEALNSCGSLTFEVQIEDDIYDGYERLKSRVLVKEDGAIQFVGRLLRTTIDFQNTKKLVFEGEMALLNDVLYPPYEFSGSIAEFLTNVINYYNSKCSTENQIIIGRITMVDKNNYIVRSNTDYSTCWEAISDKLIDLCGGYLSMRWVLDGSTVYRYLDYLENPGAEASQKIEYAKNILDVGQEIDATDICTVLYPFGAKDESTGEKVDISSVNGGKKYITSNKLSLFGVVEKIVEFEDVTLPSNLLSKAKAYLEEHDSSITTLTVKALDLHVLDDIYVRFNVGDTVHVYSKPNSIDTYMMISERTRNLNNPDKDELTLGKVVETFTSSVDKPGMSIESDENALNYVDVEYGLSDSSTVAPTIWSTDSPAWTAGKYIWQRTKCVYINGTITYSNIACIQGAKGEDGKDGLNGTDGTPGTDGTDGRGISSVEEQYYLSSSNTSLVNGTWSISCPEWKKGYYIWTRSKITWMNPTETTYTDAVLSTALNQANENANEALESIPSDEHIKDIAKLQTNLLLGANGGYMEVLNDAEEKPIALRFMDSMIASSAKNVLLINQNGIGFSNTGVNGPFYNAWTIDGHLSADIIYTGILQDRTGNFKLNMDTGEISVQRLTLNTPELIFGDLSNQYIKISNYSDSSGNKVGVLFDGTGQIIMTPEGKLDISNYVSNKLYNQFQMAYSSTGKQIYLWNKKQLDTNNANSISLQSTESANTFNVINYDLNSTYVGNQISLYSQKNSTYAYHTSELINRCVGNSYNANTLNFHSYKYDAGSWGNSITVDNYRKDNGVRANRLYIASSENYDFAEFGNIYQYSDGTYTYLPYINGIICQINKSDYINSLQIQNYPYENHNIRGNEIELKSNTVSSNGYRTIRIVNYNNDNDTVSNVIEMRKQDTSNYIDLSCFSAGIAMATIQLSAFGNLNITTKDRTNHTHGIAIYTLGANGTYKDDAISINGHVLKFENGYVKYS